MNYKYILNDNTPLFKDFLLNIQASFQKSDQSVHKARNELKIIHSNNLYTIVKSFGIPNIIRRIIYTYFRDSKAKKSYEYSLKLNHFSPQPIGYIEFYKYNLLSQSYFVSEKFDYDFTIREPLLDKNFNDREEIFKAFARFSLELHNHGIFHNDYSPGNILIKKENEKFIFKIVDVNRMKFFQLTQKDRAKNFSKLWADEKTLTVIVNEYKKAYESSNTFLNEVLYYSNKNKQIKNFKKKLKGKKID